MFALEGLVIDNVINVFSLSLAFALIGLNVYLSGQVLNVTDLTCDASVSLGGCIYGASVVCGINPGIAFLIAVFFGAIAGLATSSITVNLKMEPVLASIVVLTALQTFIAKISGFGQIIATKSENKALLSAFSASDNAVTAVIITLCLCILFFKILNSEYGLAMRVYGDGQIIARSMGINTSRVLCVGLGIGNAMSAAAGALIAQISGTFNAAMGNGGFVFGLAAIIIGSKLVSPVSVKSSIIGCFFGSFIYKIMIEAVTFGGTETTWSEYNSVIIALSLIFLVALIQDSSKKRRII
jgi:putative ABC transport system permease protein